MVATGSIQPRFISTFVGDCRFLPSVSRNSFNRFLKFSKGGGLIYMQFPRSFSGLTNSLFNRRNVDDNTVGSKRKPLNHGTLSPPRPVPIHIQRPPYVKTKKLRGFVNKPEIHYEKGVEFMTASGSLAAQVVGVGLKLS